MKRFSAYVVSAFMALVLAMPVSAQTNTNTNMNMNTNTPANLNTSLMLRTMDPFLNFMYRQLRADVSSVDAASKTVYIRRGFTSVPVHANNAVVVGIDQNGARIISVSDLRVGGRAFFLVKRTFGLPQSYDAVLVAQSVEGSITPPPPQQPAVNFNNENASGTESLTSVSIPVSLSAVTNQDVKVHYSVTGGTAAGGGVDFTLNSGDLTIPAGQRSASIPLKVVDDQLVENDETVIIRLSNPSNAMLGSRSVFTYTIRDNDQQQPSLPSVGFSVESHQMPESAGTVTHTINLSKVSENPVTVKYTVTGTTTNGVDYTGLPASGTLSIPAGQTSYSFPLTIVDDHVKESNETIVITLSDPTNATLGSVSTHTHTIVDND